MLVKHEWIPWANERQGGEIGQVVHAEGFPGCVGFIDGTSVLLSQKPAIDEEVYFDRKHRYFQYSVAMQVTCDVDKHIVMMYVGCPGSRADSTVFKQMRNPTNASHLGSTY